MVTVLSKDAAEAAIPSGRFKQLVSFRNYGGRFIQGWDAFQPVARVAFFFDDITHLPPPGGYYPPTREHIATLCNFLRHVPDGGRDLLIHCEQGVARSPAAAIIFELLRLGPGHEDQAIANVHRTVPNMDPNKLMLEYAATVLRTGDGLGRALARFTEHRRAARRRG